MTTAIWPITHHRGPVMLREPVLITCALLSTGAAVIHFAVLGEHWREWWGYGLIFGVAAWLQLAWAAAVVARPSRKLVVAGAVGNLAIAAMWVMTRTSGVPLGPEAGEAESTTLIDAVATGFEVALAVGAGAAILARVERLTLGRRVAGATVLAVAVAVVVLTTTSLVDASSPGGTHGGENHAAHDD